MIIYGNLGKNPQKRVTDDGKTFVSLSIAEQRGYVSKDTGEFVETGTDWHNVLIFAPIAQAHALNMRKGTRVKLEGTLSYQVALKATSDDEFDILSTTIIGHRIELAPLVPKSK